MPFSVEDRSTIKVLRQDKQYGAETLLKMFLNKNWTLGGLKTLLRKIDATDSVKRRSGSGRLSCCDRQCVGSCPNPGKRTENAQQSTADFT